MSVFVETKWEVKNLIFKVKLFSVRLSHRVQHGQKFEKQVEEKDEGREKGEIWREREGYACQDARWRQSCWAPRQT